MSTNLGTILVGLGYDLSALERGAPEAFRLINQQTLGMSAEMKRSSREGAESLRLIDEALGIHLSRPLTRILTQEFPGLAKGLQEILGAGVVGAIAVAGIEFFDKVSKSIEKAQKAQEDLAKSTQAVETVFAEEIAAYKEKDKAITAATAAVNRLIDAEEKQAKAAADAAGPWNHFLAAVGDFGHQLFSFESTLNIEKINKQLGEFKTTYDKMALADSLNHGGQAAAALAEEIKKATTAYGDLQTKMADQQKTPRFFYTGPGAGAPTMPAAITPEEVTAAKAYLDALIQIQKIQTSTISGVHDQEGQAAALERQKAAASAIADLYRSIGESLKKLAPETDPLKKLSEEIRLMRLKAEQDFAELGRNSNDALQLKAAHAALLSYESALDRIFAKAKADSEALKAFSALPTKISAGPALPELPTGNAQLPVLGAGGTAGAQLEAFAKDQVAQLTAAAAAYQQLLTPADKFAIKQSELNLLLHQGLIDQAAYTAAMQTAREEMSKSTDQVAKLLEKTDSAGAGAKAFFLQLENEGGKNGNAAFTFEFLNKGLQGFEDETVKALTGAKTNWRQFFLDLDQMALKFVLNKELAGLFKMLSESSIGKSLGLDKLLAGAVNPSQVANTAALATNTAALAANTAALLSSAASGLGTAAGAAGFTFGPGDASGTDYAPGGLTMVGEEGPELVNLPAGASVTANSSMRGMPPMVFHIDAKGAEIGVEDKIARSLSAAMPHIVMRAVVESAERQKRTVRG